MNENGIVQLEHDDDYMSYDERDMDDERLEEEIYR